MILARIACWRAWLALGVVLSLGATVPSRAGQESGGWKQLNLRETTLAGTRVYYEQSLEPNLPALERGLTMLADGRDKLAEVLARREEIIAEINRILGVADPDLRDQDNTFLMVGGTFAQTKLTFYFVTKTTIKEFLRSGGQLPDFEYDRASDTAGYNPKLAVPRGTKPPATWEFCIPMPEEHLESLIVQGLGRVLGGGMVDTAIHEVTEMTLLLRVRPTDPYWRWFSDGFANAITRTLLARYVSSDAAEEFARLYDPNGCRDLEKQANLGYWMLGNYTVYTSDAPVPAESSIQHARYTYSTLEAQRLIDRHGLDCVRRILDAVCAGDSRKGSDLLEVIRTVTGEDMKERLGHYQTFETQAEGIAKYANAYQESLQAKNLEQMFVNVLRLMEVRGDVGSLNYLQSFKNAALFLARMDHEEAGDEVMRRAIDLYSKAPGRNGRLVALEMSILYAIECNRPRKAMDAAEELLEANPQNVPALTLKMLISLQDQDLSKATEYARQIQSLSPQQSTPYQLAGKILAIDPNSPPGYKGPSEQK